MTKKQERRRASDFTESKEVVMKSTRKKIVIDPEQPTWVCHKCGVKYGSFRCGIATWHNDTCGVCGKEAAVTEPRDFGYLLAGWKQRQEESDEA